MPGIGEVWKGNMVLYKLIDLCQTQRESNRKRVNEWIHTVSRNLGFNIDACWSVLVATCFGIGFL